MGQGDFNIVAQMVLQCILIECLNILRKIAEQSNPIQCVYTHNSGNYIFKNCSDSEPVNIHCNTGMKTW